ncbi:MAG: acyltransferase [Clostridia bacterium]|nr:acyltransferase [Clostridia bacterium]
MIHISILDLIAFLPVIVLFVISRQADNKSIFDRDSTTTLRGIAMIWIIVHHIVGRSALGGSPLLTYIGYFATGLFFFISGYGNTISIEKRYAAPASIKFEWLFKKIKKIYIPFFFVYLLCYLYIFVFTPSTLPSLKNTVTELFTVSLPNSPVWFTKIILLCFLLHWVFKKAFAKLTPSVAFVAVSIAITAYVLYMIVIKADSYWYNSVLCYPLGILVAIKKDYILKAIDTKNKKYLFLTGLAVAFIIAFLATKLVGYMQIPTALLFSLLCFSYTAIFKSKSRFLAFIGNNSFEFFLVHLACLNTFHGLVSVNKYLYVFTVIAATLAAVYVYTTIKKLLFKENNNVR